MAITTADLKIFASARMTDAPDGGGPMTGNALQDGAANNIFPDQSGTDRAFGRLQLRKIVPAVVRAGVDSLLGAHVILDAMPTDPDTSAWAFAGTGAAQTRQAAVAALEQPHWMPLGAGGGTRMYWKAEPRTQLLVVNGDIPIVAGSVVYADHSGGDFQRPVLITSAAEIATSGAHSSLAPYVAGSSKLYAVVFDGDGTDPEGNSNDVARARLGVPSTATPRLASTRPVVGALAIGDSGCTVDTVLVQVVPKHVGSEPGSASQTGINPALVQPAGVAACIRGGDGLVLHHDANTATATAVTGGTVSAGRANLSAVRVVGANGASILTGWTADLAAGTVHWDDVTGWSQPVFLRHTIAEVMACSRIGYPEIPGNTSVGANYYEAGPFSLSVGAALFGGRTNVGGIRVYSTTGQDITDLTFQNNRTVAPFVSRWFLLDLQAGTATLTLDTPAVSGATAAFTSSHSPVRLVSSGSYAGALTPTLPQSALNRVTFNRPLTRAFPSGTLLSSMLLLGDLQARCGAAFSQQTWTGIWADARIGDAITAQYQQVAHPLVVSNLGAVTERWAVIFLTSTTYRFVGETLGQIATGDVNSTFAPVNPNTGTPYITIDPTGWGTWPAGATLRFNTTGANGTVWAARVTLPSAPTDTPDGITYALRGDIDR